MIAQSFTLLPFPALELPAISLGGTVFFEKNILTIQYVLTGDIERVLFPARSTTPSRKDELWKATCFEFFLAFHDKPEYWEFNMSPPVTGMYIEWMPIGGLGSGRKSRSRNCCLNSTTDQAIVRWMFPWILPIGCNPNPHSKCRSQPSSR